MGLFGSVQFTRRLSRVGQSPHSAVGFRKSAARCLQASEPAGRQGQPVVLADCGDRPSSPPLSSAMPSSPSAGVLAQVAMESASAADDEAAQLTRVCELWEAATARAEEQHGLESEKLMLPLIKAAEVMPSPTFTSHIHVRWWCDGTDAVGRATDPLHSCSVHSALLSACVCMCESATTPCSVTMHLRHIICAGPALPSGNCCITPHNISATRARPSLLPPAYRIPFIHLQPSVVHALNIVHDAAGVDISAMPACQHVRAPIHSRD
jgi:hypothetical protein